MKTDETMSEGRVAAAVRAADLVKGAVLKIKLVADSGYSNASQYRINAVQWRAITEILEDGQ